MKVVRDRLEADQWITMALHNIMPISIITWAGRVQDWHNGILLVESGRVHRNSIQILWNNNMHQEESLYHTQEGKNPEKIANLRRMGAQLSQEWGTRTHSRTKTSLRTTRLELQYFICQRSSAKWLSNPWDLRLQRTQKPLNRPLLRKIWWW